MTLPIIYEDEHVLAIDKPYGIAVHKVSPTDPQDTIADMLVRERPYLVGVGESPLRPGIVHRLDKETSGIMLIAKDQQSFEYLKNLFQTRQVTKEYYALVHGTPPNKRGTIDLPLGKIGTRQTTQLKGHRELVERDALTDYEVIRQYTGYALVRVMPKTGRTHQIRVHMKAIGCPLAGDSIYAPDKAMPAGLERLFLHAYALRFTTPPDLPAQAGGKALALETDLDPTLQAVLDALQ